MDRVRRPTERERALLPRLQERAVVTLPSRRLPQERSASAPGGGGVSTRPPCACAESAPRSRTGKGGVATLPVP
eukprot:1896685-Alexandrium_andersonii.AAC.1